jgi:hypothetical protein
VQYGLALSTRSPPCAVSPGTTSAQNPLTGTRILDASRSTPAIKDQATDAYCFPLQSDRQIKCEIPSLGEVVTGKTDGLPMEVHRANPSAGRTLSVTAEGPEVRIYKVARNGKPEGEGRITMVENGSSCVDIPWPAGKPQYAGEKLCT